MNARKYGFTIVELVIVIAVIGILATIGMISYGSYRTRAAKSAVDSTTQQVKLKLGEYFTDNNNYPVDKTVLDTYLRSISATSLADSFKNMTDNGATYAPTASDGSSCASVPCMKYTITVPATYWKGQSTDASIVVTP